MTNQCNVTNSAILKSIFFGHSCLFSFQTLWGTHSSDLVITFYCQRKTEKTSYFFSYNPCAFFVCNSVVVSVFIFHAGRQTFVSGKRKYQMPLSKKPTRGLPFAWHSYMYIKKYYSGPPVFKENIHLETRRVEYSKTQCEVGFTRSPFFLFPFFWHQPQDALLFLAPPQACVYQSNVECVLSKCRTDVLVNTYMTKKWNGQKNITTLCHIHTISLATVFFSLLWTAKRWRWKE